MLIWKVYFSKFIKYMYHPINFNSVNFATTKTLQKRYVIAYKVFNLSIISGITWYGIALFCAFLSHHFILSDSTNGLISLLLELFRAINIWSFSGSLLIMALLVYRQMGFNSKVYSHKKVEKYNSVIPVTDHKLINKSSTSGKYIPHHNTRKDLVDDLRSIIKEQIIGNDNYFHDDGSIKPSSVANYSVDLQWFSKKHGSNAKGLHTHIQRIHSIEFLKRKTTSEE